MNVLWETMIDELRATRAELDHRRHFTEEKQPIELARDLVTGWTEPPAAKPPALLAAENAMHLRRAASQNLIEVG